MSVAISWANKMQLAKCDIMVGFPISSHIYKLANYCHNVFYVRIWHLCQDIYIYSYKMWLEVRSRLVKKRLWLKKTIITSFSIVGIKRDNF